MAAHNFPKTPQITAMYETLQMGGRYPLLDNRIFDTLADAQAFTFGTDGNRTAIPGLILRVIHDEDPAKNGAYIIYGDETTREFTLEPICKGGSTLKWEEIN